MAIFILIILLISVFCFLCVQTYVKLMKKQQKELSSLKKKHVKVGDWNDPEDTQLQAIVLLLLIANSDYNNKYYYLLYNDMYVM